MGVQGEVSQAGEGVGLLGSSPTQVSQGDEHGLIRESEKNPLTIQNLEG